MLLLRRAGPGFQQRGSYAEPTCGTDGATVASITAVFAIPQADPQTRLPNQHRVAEVRAVRRPTEASDAYAIRPRSRIL